MIVVWQGERCVCSSTDPESVAAIVLQQISVQELHKLVVVEHKSKAVLATPLLSSVLLPYILSYSEVYKETVALEDQT